MLPTMFGVLAINKPATWTSRDAVNRVQGIVRPSKVGHTGTLDPMATGVLLLAVGRASRLVEFSHGYSKRYEADFELGRTSDTLDTDGDVQLLEDAPIPTRDELQSEAERWIGNVQQIPPKYSAINVQGRRAYDLARQGKTFDLKSRPVTIHQIEILEYTYPRFRLRIHCGTGTYVRSLGSDIARGLNSDAVMSRLVRTQIGPFTLQDCVELAKLVSPQDVLAHLRPAQMLLADMSHVVLTPELAQRIRNGLPIDLGSQSEDRLAALDESHRLVAVLDRTPQGVYRSLRVFHNENETIQPHTIKTPHNPES
jgi:tRNA pseudouridine55 synthase